MTTFSDLSLGRRGLIFGAGSVALALGGAPLAAQTAPASEIDFESARDNLKAYMKLAYSLRDDEMVMGWFGGHVLSLIDNEPLRPLMGIEGFGVGSARRNADGSYSSIWKEVAYYRDLKTGAVLTEWVNPITAKTNLVMPIHNLGVHGHFDTSFRRVSGGPPGLGDSDIQYGNYSRQGDAAMPFILPWTHVGGTTNLWMDISAVMKNPLSPAQWPMESSGPRIRIAEEFLYTCRTADLLNPSLNSVDYTGSWNRFSAWLPWMEMAQRPGGLFIRAATKRLRGYDELPRRMRDDMARFNPEYLDPKVDPNHKSESSWEVFMRDRKPAPVS